jgi:hypothetical protein
MPRSDHNWDEYLHLLLAALLEKLDIIPLSWRILHSSNFRNVQTHTLELLLKEGVDPLHMHYSAFGANYTTVNLVLAMGDDNSLSLLVRRIRGFNDEPTILNNMSCSLQERIVQDSERCFGVILNEFPQLVNYVAESRREQYKKYRSSWDVAMSIPEPAQFCHLNPAWEQWHDPFLGSEPRSNGPTESREDSSAPDLSMRHDSCSSDLNSLIAKAFKARRQHKCRV